MQKLFLFLRNPNNVTATLIATALFAYFLSRVISTNERATVLTSAFALGVVLTFSLYAKFFWRSPQELEERQFVLELKKFNAKAYERRARQHWEEAQTHDSFVHINLMAENLRELNKKIAYIGITKEMIREEFRKYFMENEPITNKNTPEGHADFEHFFQGWCKNHVDIL